MDGRRWATVLALIGKGGGGSAEMSGHRYQGIESRWWDDNSGNGIGRAAEIDSGGGDQESIECPDTILYELATVP